MDFKPTNEMVESARNVFVTMALVETVKPIVKGYQMEILAKHQWPIAKEWSDRVKAANTRVILNPDETYLMEDEDFQIYIKEINEARESAGLKVENPDFCPLLVAEDLQSKAEHLLIDVMEPITHLTIDKVLCSVNGLDNYRKLIDLTLKLLVKFVNKEA